MADEQYDVLDTEKEYLDQQGAQDDAALVNDSLNVAPDAGVQELDQNPPTDQKMIEEDDK